MAELKRNEVLALLDGSLTIKMDGHGETIGWGEWSFDERQVEIVPHDDDSRSSMVIETPKSELIELRDFLLRIFPLTTRK